eukprot:GFUD01000080.1.p1 GENE.GFUD01000080.1~~GFUD01000080.1.p1  ORF type:complete len:1171 (-),score=266.56 GFUD01000080.1:163-3675(-)
MDKHSLWRKAFSNFKTYFQSPEQRPQAPCAVDSTDTEGDTDMDNNSLTPPHSFHGRRKSTRKAKHMTWGRVRSHLLISNKARGTVETFVDGDAQEIWPKSAAWFLGPKAENSDLLGELVKSAVDLHVEFRKFKYFPLDPNYVTSDIKEQKSFKEAENNIRDGLEELSSRLNNSVPFFNFRSQGHMLWDTTIASNIGYIAALFYNQNNVASMASGVTLQLEREVSKELCAMVGYNVYQDEKDHTTENPGSWGHLPNGGTVANLEAMWAARCLKTNGLTFRKMLDEKSDKLGLRKVYDKFTFKNLKGENVLLKKASIWELLNIPIDEAIDLFDSLLENIKKEKIENKDLDFDNLFRCVKNFTLEQMGAMDFFRMFKKEYKNANMEPSMGKWFSPGTRHYSWDTGANILGLGRDNLVKVPVDQHSRMDLLKLKEELQKCLVKKIPVIGVTVVFGSTQEGAVDDLENLLRIREVFETKGLTFYIHVDGAWGGYFASCLVQKDKLMRMRLSTYSSRNNVTRSPRPVRREACDPFLDAKLSTHFTTQLVCLGQANSITLDPHKSGFCPYPAGGLLYKNGNIRKFLAQTAAYVSHGTGKNDEINLYGIDGSKPGAASAGVWLSHKVIGLHNKGYGLLLQQSTFSAGVMYALWCSMERRQDPFTIVPGIPIKENFKNIWTKSKIRSEILEAETGDLRMNEEAMKFIKENGPDTLINSLSINIRYWDKKTNSWENNKNVAKQKDFINKFYKRCSHSYEKPSMVDRGIQVILNSTIWTKNANGGAYKYMKEALGLDEKDDESIGVIINTSMSPWLRAQKTFKRVGFIIRNEMYNAYGAIHDEPQNLKLVSPNLTHSPEWSGSIFAELETSFSNPSLCYHALGRFVFDSKDIKKIQEISSGKLLLRIVTREKMTVYDLMTGGDKENINQTPTQERKPSSRKNLAMENIKDKIEFYSDSDFHYQDIAMPEVSVTVFYETKDGKIQGEVDTKMKLGRVLRYQHLGRDFVDEDDYPPSQEYFLYADDKTAYLSHCPNRWPDFQQQIQLDQIPVPQAKAELKNCPELFEEAMKRGVVVYLPQCETGGRPVLSRSKTKTTVCRDPLECHFYNALAWSDQGAFTGDMEQITLKFYDVGKRWFNGKKINAGYCKVDFPHLYKQEGDMWMDRREDDSDYEVDSSNSDSD